MEFAVEDLESNGSGAEFLSVNGEAAEITDLAMNGDMPFQAATEERLHLVQPTAEYIQETAWRYVDQLTPGFAETMKISNLAGIRNVVVTLGFRQALALLEQEIDADYYALDLYQDRRTGKFTRLGDQSILLLPNGKRLLMQKLINEGNIRLPYSGEGDGVGDIRMGGTVKIAMTGHVRRPAALEECCVETPNPYGSLPIKLGEVRWKGWNGQIQPIVDYGVGLIANGVVKFHDSRLEEAFVPRAQFHLDHNRDRDSIIPLPRNGTIFNRKR
ncbi:MAG: HAD-superfamily hydrolase, subfamily IB (PSPase-like) [Candidatus Gottesmanbacteria bacterium GW2011_GWA2_42_18]|nr:MAG: HAD-superfamily hydrolase, subfamily IB (PSPase-like) [Candidatus Gottesmanbacteria bacterium GW2011_GWA2_42_18]KKS76179.1 MAG: HAD-superfamily hydrolase, subfamily IB (PSPase-like) [Candidatus Gottesmanbacteria bacterium GW2011_GWC2_42_8]